MRYTIRTILYFITWGITYGTVLGGISGTLIFPMFGTMYSIPWGLGMGAALGVAMGILTAIINAVSFRPDTNITTYRRNLASGIGTLTAIGAAVLLIATTNGFLWGGYSSAGMEMWLFFSLIAAVFWGGLSSAFAASRFVDWYAGLMTKRKNDEMPDDILNEIEQQGGGVWSYLKRVLRNWWIPLAGAATAGLLHSTTWAFGFQFLGRLVEGSIVGFVYSGVLMLLLGFHTGFFLHVLNRLLFREYLPNLSFVRYRRYIAPLAGLFTMATSVVVTGFIGAIPAGLIALWIAWRYADWYAAEPAKDKRKAHDSAARLAETLPEETVDNDVDDYLRAVEQSRTY